MSGESSYFKLGMFVIVGIALLIAGVVVLGAGALMTDYVKIETATASSVQGLDVGAAVKFNGVTIGKVGRIQLARAVHRASTEQDQFEIDKFIIIQMDIRRDQLLSKAPGELQSKLADMISRGLRARMASSGLTGPAYLEVVILNPEQYPPVTIPWRQDGLFVPSAPNTMSQIVTGVETIISELRRANLGKVVGDADRLINNADTSIQELQVAELREKAAGLLDEARGATARVKQMLDSPQIDQTMKELPMIAERMRETVDRVNEIVHDPKIQQTLDGLSTTASAAAPAAVELRRVMKEVQTLLTSQQQDIESIVVNLRRVLENANAITQDAKQNPSRLLFGEPPPHINPGGRK
jgi:ABC-type transporter Mla subunit MlaD